MNQNTVEFLFVYVYFVINITLRQIRHLCKTVIPAAQHAITCKSKISLMFSKSINVVSDENKNGAISLK